VGWRVIEIANMLLGGLAAGMVLFIVSVGLSVTMGLMGFVNLAHGGFAMIGGYVIVLAMNKLGVPFLPATALGFIVVAAISAVMERLLYARLYRAPELDQVLFTHRPGVHDDRAGDLGGRAGNPADQPASLDARASSTSAS
jgi:branched-chain amino acid transport system permease protein